MASASAKREKSSVFEKFKRLENLEKHSVIGLFTRPGVLVKP